MDLALFDFDGTITTRDTMPGFVRGAVPRWRLAAGYALLWPMLVGYRRGHVSGTAIRAAIVRIGFSGLPVDAVDAFGITFAETDLAPLVRSSALARIDWHRRRGDTVVVVSGGLDVYLAPWARTHGLPLLCSLIERWNGRFTGRYAGRQCVRQEKARRVRAAYDLSTFERVHAYGDTEEDRAMLDMSDVAHFRSMPLPA